MVRMCALSPRFSWITSAAPYGAAAPANTPNKSPRGPANVISSAVGSPTPDVVSLATDDATDELDATEAVVDAGAVLSVGGVVDPDVDDGAPSSSSEPHPANSAAAAGADRPNNSSRRTASRRLNRPSAQSSATSSTR